VGGSLFKTGLSRIVVAMNGEEDVVVHRHQVAHPVGVSHRRSEETQKESSERILQTEVLEEILRVLCAVLCDLCVNSL
jgi:hypothetical protein